MSLIKAKLGVYVASILIGTVAFAAEASTNDLMQTGPKVKIDELSESHFYVDGSTGSGKVFKFFNGERSLYFIPMIHQAEPTFYVAVANEVQHLKANGMDLYYEFIDFEAATLADKQRIRAMLGFLPSPNFYAENVSDGLVGQKNAMFLGFPGGYDINVDVTPADIADAYEAMFGPLEITEENLTAPMDSFVVPTSDPSQISQITIDWRNVLLAQAINEATRDIVVLYGAAHGAGTMRSLNALDPSWKHVD